MPGLAKLCRGKVIGKANWKCRTIVYGEVQLVATHRWKPLLLWNDVHAIERIAAIDI